MGRGTEVRNAGTERGLGVVTDYFAAPGDALAATVVDAEDGPSTSARGSGEPLFDTVRMPSVEPFVMLGTLAEVVCGRPYGEVTADPRHGVLIVGADEGPWVVTVSTELTERLATTSALELTDAALRWVGRAPAVRAEQVVPAVVALGELAWRAAEVRHDLYCWTRLPEVPVRPAR